MTPIQSAWMVNSGNQGILGCKINFVFYMGTIRSLFDSH